MKQTLVGAAVAAALLIAVAGATLGHAGLVTSDPADGATITTPYRLTATFEEAFDPERSSLAVFDATDTEVATAEVDPADDTTMDVELPELDLGTYTVRWTTVTPDDNGIERGVFTFNVAEAPATAAPTARPTSAVGPTPAPTGSTGDGQPGSGNDVLLALAVAGAALIGVGLFVFMRIRR